MNTDKIIGIFGGTGFLGHNIVQSLAKEGYRIKIITRHPQSAYDLKLFGTVGQITPFYCDYKDEDSINNAVAGCDYVVNLIGILYQKNKHGFKRAHVDIPQMIATACKAKHVQRYVHISALSCDKGSDDIKSKYAKSKFEGEQAVTKAFEKTTILRPSVVFGPDDSFFNMFAKLATFLPALPLIGGGKTKFQPVYVGDIAQAVTKIIKDPTNQFAGHIYELGGPEVVTFKEIYEILLLQTNRDRALITIPWKIAKVQGAIMGLLPHPPLTLDQVKSLKIDNIINGDEKTLTDLGIKPTAMDSILPSYLSTYKRGGRFATK